ncbi:hypothetical protein EVA_14963 [gut metagenome]|uniref:Uncharacterized protein n=1 Tax=gut metagenome TaxID=749906 RepID=J9FPQ0_9ZZZZ
METLAKVIHGRKCSLPANDCIDKELLQDNHPKDERKRIWAFHNEPY